MRAGAFGTWRLIREARQAAGLTQNTLAHRAGTTQSAVARYETAGSLPDIDTLHRLLAASGHRLELRAIPIEEQRYQQMRDSLALTPRQRIERNRRVTRLAAKAAQAHRHGRVRPLNPA